MDRLRALSLPIARRVVTFEPDAIIQERPPQRILGAPTRARTWHFPGHVGQHE